MASQYTRTDNCRIYQEEQLQHFNPTQPFSTAGGHADLYRASHAEDGELALKRLRWGTEDLADRFALATQEASVWQVLRHPNVLEFLGILYSSSHIYLISPFASHGSLPQYLQTHPDADRPIFIYQISSGLAYLHSKDVIHGDVKGANILVSPALTAQLCDFGLSELSDTAASAVNVGVTLPWLSPERMDRYDSPRTMESDVYAFGMTIYEILSGHIPFHRLGINELIVAVCIHDARPPLSPEHSNSGTSYTVMWMLAQMCWARQPERRPFMADSCAFLQYHWTGFPALPGTEQAPDSVIQGENAPVEKDDACHDSSVPAIPISLSDATAILRKRIDKPTKYDELSRATRRLKLHHHRKMELDPGHTSKLIAEITGDDISNAERCGGGGFGDVYKLHHPSLGELALKHVRTHGNQQEVDAQLRRATREAGTWQQLVHPNILAFFGVLERSGGVYLISPFIQNGTIGDFVGRHPNADRVRLIQDTAAGIAYLHQSGIVHGDIKGANILVADDFRALLCDFGLARAQEIKTSTGMQGMGTIPWQSPELLDSGGGKTFKSDVWAFAMTIYEVLSGRTPYDWCDRVPALVMEVIHRKSRPPQEPLTSPNGVSYVVLWAVARDCWHEDPDQRPEIQEAHDRLFRARPMDID